MTFTEGPCWFDDARGGYLIFSDIPANHLKRWTAKDGLSVFRDDSNYANGNTRDTEGRLLTCEHQARRVTRTEKDGGVTGLADKFEGKALHLAQRHRRASPTARSGSPTRPTACPKGRSRNRPASTSSASTRRPSAPRPSRPTSTSPTAWRFSPDEKKLYIADSDPKKNHIRVFDVAADGTLTNGRLFCKIDKACLDGIRVDSAGRVFSSAKDGVADLRADRREGLGKILLPEVVRQPDLRRQGATTSCS